MTNLDDATLLPPRTTGVHELTPVSRSLLNFTSLREGCCTQLGIFERRRRIRRHKLDVELLYETHSPSRPSRAKAVKTRLREYNADYAKRKLLCNMYLYSRVSVNWWSSVK